MHPIHQDHLVKASEALAKRLDALEAREITAAEQEAAKERRFLEFLNEQRRQINKEVDEQERKVWSLEGRVNEMKKGANYD